MRHVFEHARRLGFRTQLRIAPEIVLAAPRGKTVPRGKAIEFLRELASLNVDYRAVFHRGRRGFTQVRISSLAPGVGDGKKHRNFHAVWKLLVKLGHRPVRVR
jgi:hypothetical protein